MTDHQPRLRLRKHIHEFAEILDMAEFWASDLDGPTGERQATINLLRTSGAIEKVGWERNGRSKRYRWGWINHREYLQDYHEQQDKLPCGCRSHIPGEQDGETYFCKFCGTGHGRDVIKEAL